MMKLRFSEIPGLFEILAETAEVYAPGDEDGRVRLTKWQGGQPTQDYINPDNSLKDLLYPQTEELARFEGGYEDLSISEPTAPPDRVIFGTRPCDALALARFGRVFTEGDFTDERFSKQREATMVITVACEQSGPDCFCTAMGGSPAGTRGSDVVCYPLDDSLYLEAVTDGGDELLSQLEEHLEEAADEEAERAREHCESTEASAADGLPVREFGEDLFDHPLWAHLSERCLSCGVCGYVCPSCYCFAIFDAVRGTCGKRMRGWDSCQFEDFSLMAADHNPRPTPLERIRQRFMHKLVYFPESYEEFQCVGCGRCVTKCPVGLHMLAVITDLEEVI